MTPPEKYAIRSARLDDVPQICELLGYLFSKEAEFIPAPALQAEGLRRILSNPEIGRILLLEKDGIVAGMVNLLFTISTALGGRVALLEDMVIAPEFQNMGFGSALLDAALKQARESGCLRVTLLTDADNSGAIRFYEQRGFTLSGMRPMRLIF